MVCVGEPMNFVLARPEKRRAGRVQCGKSALLRLSYCKRTDTCGQGRVHLQFREGNCPNGQVGPEKNATATTRCDGGCETCSNNAQFCSNSLIMPWKLHQ